MLNGIKIMIMEGSDILKDNLDNVFITKKYKGVFSDSLLLDKLKEYKIKVNEKEKSTTDIIMLNFSYGYNSKNSDKYINQQNVVSKDLKILNTNLERLYRKIDKILNDNVKFNKEIEEYKSTIAANKLIMNEINKVEIKKTNKSLANKINTKEYKIITNYNKENMLYNNVDIVLDTIDILQSEYELLSTKYVKMDKDKIREELYQNGFYLDYYKKDKEGKYIKDDTIEYVFWFRTPSKSRCGDCVFINKKLYDKTNKWQTMDIELIKDEDNKVKKVEMEAYKSLTASHIERKIFIPCDNILVVNDLTSFINTKCSEVHYHIADEEININDTEDMCFVRNNVGRVKSTLWDGMMLLDKEYCCNNQFMLLRNHFFKACAFSSNIKQFFIDYCKDNVLDYNTYQVPDRYGNMKLVKNIIAITTENAMKWEKLFDDKQEGYKSWIKHVKADGELFGVCKTDHKSKYGDYQRMSYQMVNTLPINQEESIQLVNDTKQVIKNMKNDNTLFIKHLQRTANEMNNNNMIIDLFKHNSKFADTRLFRTYKTKSISEYKETLREGKLLTNGDNLTVCGNPYALLLHSVGALDIYITDNNIITGYNDNTLPKLNNGYVSCYTKRFSDEVLTAFRNPHNSFSNILKLKNKSTNEIMDKYFNFGSNVIAIDMINSDSQERCNSMDEDSDFIYTTNNLVIKEAMADKNYACIVNKIAESKKTYEDNNLELAKIDNGLAESRYCIGLSSNISQLALSWYWKNSSQELEDIVSICSVLAQCSIDNSKRLYEVDLNLEITRIRKLKCMNVKTKNELVAKPYFWQFVKEIKEKERKYDIVKTNITDNLTEEEIKNIKKQDRELTKINNIQAKTEAKKIKNDKIDNLKIHCIEEKICPMDWIQDAIDKIKSASNSDNKLVDEFNLIKTVDGKAKQEQMDKIMEQVKKLDDIYKKQNDKDNYNKMDDESFLVYSIITADEIINKIGSYSIKEKNMEMLIKNTLCLNKTRPATVENNSKYRLRLLNCLYKSHKDVFLSVWNEK